MSSLNETKHVPKGAITAIAIQESKNIRKVFTASSSMKNTESDSPLRIPSIVSIDWAAFHQLTLSSDSENDSGRSTLIDGSGSTKVRSQQTLKSSEITKDDVENLKTQMIDEMDLQNPRQQITENEDTEFTDDSIRKPPNEDRECSELIKREKSPEITSNDAMQSESTESIEAHIIDQQSNPSNNSDDDSTECTESQRLRDWSDRKKKEMNAKYDHFFNETLKSPKYIMAPMVCGSELPFRMMGRKYGCDVCYTPMASAKSVIEAFEQNGNLDGRLLFHKLDRPLIVQLCGNDPELIVKAVQIIESIGDICDGIDINLGCPQTVAEKCHFGAFLLDNPQIVRSMVTALCSKCTLPICAKIRILSTFEETVAFCDMLVQSGISMLAIHGRRREKQHHRGPADLDTIRRIKQHYQDEVGLNIPIVSNGNTMTLQV